MKNAFNRLRSGMETLNLTMLLILNLFFMVFLLLAVCTVLVLAGVDEGFLYHDGQVELGGALAFVYTVCILIAVSMVVMIRMVFIHPLQRNIEAMKKLANGDFTVRVNHAEHGYVPREMVEFEQSFNKAAEELGGTEILRKDFINNFSHEFKTPIVSISGFADLLLEEQLPPEDQKEYLTIIRDESRRLADLATNILTLNRVESQTILTDKAAFPLDEQLRQSVLVTQQKWRQKELDFDADLAPAEYTGSEGLLKEVWLNLLDNAAKFSPEGGTVAVNLRKAKNALMVSVTDQGEGMRADTQAHIFEQFYQGDTSHTTQGNGLGLAMVKKVLELHGGEQCPRAGQLLYRDITHINEKEALKSVSFCFRFKFRRGAPCARRGNLPE
jgi:signal transduction histidine kinase